MKLETERLILRKPKESDWKEIFEIVDKITIKNFVMPNPFQKKHAKYLTNSSLKDFGKKSYKFFIERKKDKKIMGMAGIKDITDKDKISETQLWLGTKYFRNYYGTEAKIAINDFAFNKLKLRKLTAEVLSINKSSNELQKRFGYVLEGIKRKDTFISFVKKYVDMNSYGIFKEEWNKVSPKLKKELKQKIRKLEK